MNQTQKAVIKANKELDAEMWKQLDIIYPAVAVTLWQEYGWRKLRIIRRFISSQDVWQECADAGNKKSMMQMLEDETGVEIRIAGYEDLSYHSLSYLDESVWDKKPPTPQQVIYMRQQQKKWIAPQLLACICLALHRVDGWGYVRIARLLSKVDELRDQYKDDRKAYSRLLEDNTTITAKEITSKCVTA